jgi:hypothetical protein
MQIQNVLHVHDAWPVSDCCDDSLSLSVFFCSYVSPQGKSFRSLAQV